MALYLIISAVEYPLQILAICVYFFWKLPV